MRICLFRVLRPLVEDVVDGALRVLRGGDDHALVVAKRGEPAGDVGRALLEALRRRCRRGRRASRRRARRSAPRGSRSPRWSATRSGRSSREGWPVEWTVSWKRVA